MYNLLFKIVQLCTTFLIVYTPSVCCCQNPATGTAATLRLPPATRSPGPLRQRHPGRPGAQLPGRVGPVEQCCWFCCNKALCCWFCCNKAIHQCQRRSFLARAWGQDFYISMQDSKSCTLANVNSPWPLWPAWQ